MIIVAVVVASFSRSHAPKPELKVCGSVPALGSWNLADAAQMQCQARPGSKAESPGRDFRSPIGCQIAYWGFMYLHMILCCFICCLYPGHKKGDDG